MEVENENTAVLGSCSGEMYTWPSGECSLFLEYNASLSVQDRRCWRLWRLRAVVRAVMLSDCCAGAPCRDMGSWVGRIMWPSRDRALLWLRGQLGGEDNVAVPGSCPADCASGMLEKTRILVASTRSRLGFGVCVGWWCRDWVCGRVVRCRRKRRESV